MKKSEMTLAINAAGYDVMQYQPRGSTKTCIGIKADNLADVFCMGADISKKYNVAAMNIGVDSLGKNFVVFFPGRAVHEPETT